MNFKYGVKFLYSIVLNYVLGEYFLINSSVKCKILMKYEEY